LKKWSDGVLEYWVQGTTLHHSVTPVLQLFPINMSDVGENTDEDFPSLKNFEKRGQGRFGHV
jgi:hypothetical protein